MSIKSKVIAAAAALTLIGGVGTAGVLGAGTASAATPSCGSSCINIFPRVYSGTPSPGKPQYAVDVLRQGERVGQPQSSCSGLDESFDPALDWTVAFQGNVSDFYAANLRLDAVALHYGRVPGHRGQGVPGSCAGSQNDEAFEIEYAPFGVDSGLCMGLAATAVQGEGVTLQGCGQTRRSVWIEDTNPGDFPAAPYYAAINGSDGDFTQPVRPHLPGERVPD